MYTISKWVASHFVPYLPWYFGNAIRERLAQADPPDEQGRLTLSFQSLEIARDRLLDLGRGVKVLDPLALRLSIADYARQIVALYAGE